MFKLRGIELFNNAEEVMVYDSNFVGNEKFHCIYGGSEREQIEATVYAIKNNKIILTCSTIPINFVGKAIRENLIKSPVTLWAHTKEKVVSTEHTIDEDGLISDWDKVEWFNWNLALDELRGNEEKNEVYCIEVGDFKDYLTVGRVYETEGLMNGDVIIYHDKCGRGMFPMSQFGVVDKNNIYSIEEYLTHIGFKKDEINIGITTFDEIDHFLMKHLDQPLWSYPLNESWYIKENDLKVVKVRDDNNEIRYWEIL